MKVQQITFNILNENGKVVESYDLTGKHEMLVNTSRNIIKKYLKKGQQFQEVTKQVSQRKPMPQPQQNVAANVMNFNVQPEDTKKIGYRQSR